MRILLCHNTYQIAGGEDTVVAAEMQLLKKSGHEVKLYQVHNDNINGIYQKIKTGLSVSYSNSSKKILKAELKSFQPDIVHFHNTFPLMTPSVYDACQELNIPVVQTLHNYRTICPGALLMREGKVCEKCVSGSPYNAAIHGCYRDSKLQSLAVSKMVARHRKSDTWNTKVNRFIALTNFARNKFTEAGFNPEKISIKPNFIQLAKNESKKPKSSFALFVGRLSEEKGIITLIEADTSVDIPLKVAGDGPLLENLTASPHENIEILGRQDQQSIYRFMRKAQFLVIPSKWYEGFPMVIVEAFAHNLPVLCSKLGAMEEIVVDGKVGCHFKTGNAQDLARKALELYQSPENCSFMGSNAREQFDNYYNAETNYNQLMNIYHEAIDDNAQ